MKYRVLKAVSSIFFVSTFIATRSAVIATPIRTVGVNDLCFDEHLVGVWRRISGDTKQQLYFFSNGDYGSVTFSPNTAYVQAADETSCPGFKDPKYQGRREYNDFYVYSTAVPSDGTVLRNPTFENNKSIMVLASATERVRYQRVQELPRIDWSKHAPDGGYTWDFKHACKQSGKLRAHLLDALMGDDKTLSSPERSTPEKIRFSLHSDYTLWWRAKDGKSLEKTSYCIPNEDTLTVAQPGPKGSVLPHTYYVFSYVGDQVFMNGEPLDITIKITGF